jgi:hypothetical protein
MPAGITRSQWQRIFFPGIREFIFQAYREKPEEFSQIFNVMSSDAAFEEDLRGAGVGLFQRVDEEDEVPMDKFWPGESVRYDHIDFGLRIGFSHQFIRDGKVTLWNERGRDLGYSARQTVEVLSADVFNNGFNVLANAPPQTAGFDNVALFSASHPIIRGGGSAGQLQSNILATAATLSVASYRDMLTLSRKLFDDTGVRRIQLTMRNLVVPPELEFVSKEIVKSAGRPDTANRADNVSRDATGVIVWDYLLNPKFWFMVAEKSQHKLKFYYRERFRTKTFMDDVTETQWILAREAFSYGYSGYIGTFGTNPT